MHQELCDGSGKYGLATRERGCVAENRFFADSVDDRVKLPSDPSRTVKGVDVLPWVLSPLMGAEEYELDVG